MHLPCLTPREPDTAAAGTESVLLAVYAPFGTDATLSTYPEGASQELAQHPLVRNLLEASRQGIHIAALVDRVSEGTHLVEIPAGQPERMRITSCWKQDMASPHTLAGFLCRAHASHPTAALVLVLEGHGAGFLPEIDRTKMTTRTITLGGTVEWKVSGNEAEAHPAVSPILPTVSPILSAASPILPANHMPISTWGLGDGLRRAQACGVPKVAVLHLNNSFNMSVEVLHTVAAYAEYATGYINYTFFTAGGSYSWVFQQLASEGTATSLDLARWFADGNDLALSAQRNQMTVGRVAQLSRMHDVAERIDDVADALLMAMRSAGDPGRRGVIAKIRQAIKDAHQLDTPNNGGLELEAPEELTDIRSLAIELQKPDFSPHPVRATAAALEQALKGNDMAMNIFLPDPMRRGLWDWRSPFYIDVSPDLNAPLVQPHIIDFLQDTNWVEFINEYHHGRDENGNEVNFKGFLTPTISEFPVALISRLQIVIRSPNERYKVDTLADAATKLADTVQDLLRRGVAVEPSAAGVLSRLPRQYPIDNAPFEVAPRSIRRGSIIFEYDIFFATVVGAWAFIGSYKKVEESWEKLLTDMISHWDRYSAKLGGVFGRSTLVTATLALRGSEEIDRDLAALSAPKPPSDRPRSLRGRSTRGM